MPEPGWGPDLPERSFVANQATLPDSDLVAAALPEVLEARELGYHLASDAPLWCFLPAIWPEDGRAWVRDRSTRYQFISCDGEPRRRLPWSEADVHDVESNVNQFLANCGLPSRPPGRLWLLRPPQRFADLDELLRHLMDSAVRGGVALHASPEIVDYANCVLADLFD